MRKIFSILVPCRNEEKTIKRLFDSILNCGLDKNEYEVIFCNDGCTDSTLDIVKIYEKDINIIYCNTNTEVHCVSNSRQIGLQYASGEWITYIDADDMFVNNSLLDVKNFIIHNNCEYCVICDFYMYKDYVIDRLNGKEQAFVMTHGKFYNKKNLIDNFNLKFQKDLLTDEDLIFNNQILNLYIGKEIILNYCPIVVLYWIQRQDSITHINNSSPFTRTDDNIDTFLYGYLGIILDYIKENTNKINNFNEILISRLVFIYVYSCIIPYRIKDNEKLYNILKIIKIYKKEICLLLNIDNEYLIKNISTRKNFNQVYNDFKEMFEMYNIKNIISFQEWLYKIDFL